LSGTLPTELGVLTTLERLDLHASRNLAGTIPSQYCRLHNLQALYLGFNDLFGSISTCIGNMVALQTLSLEYNSLTGTIPTETSRLSNLQTLILSSNLLTGKFSFIQGVIDMRLDDNALTGLLRKKSFTENSRIEHLDISSNLLVGMVPDTALQHTSLQYLDMSSNQLQGTLPSVLNNTSPLEYLILSNNQLSGTIPSSLMVLTDLSYLDLSLNNFVGEMPSFLGSMESLRYLYLADNLFDIGSIPIEYENLTSLIELSLKSTSRSGPLPDFLTAFQYLVALDLSENAIIGGIPYYFGNNINLEYLLLNQNEFLDGEVPTSLQQLYKLRVLLLDNTSLSGSVDFICQTESLEVLSADCGEVNCTCCSICCPPFNIDCHNVHLVTNANRSPQRVTDSGESSTTSSSGYSTVVMS
jgi:Leucine-rich repeat (LRR) protein